MTKKMRDAAKGIVKAYDHAMSCQGPHAHDAKLIVMANYGDLAIGILRALIADQGTKG